ncbi:MAG: hypothetical protein M2R45_05250 [Verrucomicrobia subdivision 3 bacterium]|nr:hypothetical protein [Limisphaerales bacterium]MCS1416849.1 hypothetical protein [Limisphaerales bacterium]
MTTEGARLAFKVWFEKPQHVDRRNRLVWPVVPLVGESRWQSVGLSSADFQGVMSKRIGGLEGHSRLCLGVTDRLDRMVRESPFSGSVLVALCGETLGTY